ncbi:hypothetical protein KDH_77190 [Dictyobacter sp. S3.2.2.5]|uniref:Polymerase nucleotidyl transferase domain-containing protein n=1 Tax=Dictyobacter halimunensis TaxID=3026934 RepID=A0ABQ6G4U2_9CHLR|nr:hypothetical protein KDH_77190 [Dictyobacter sp. S3.2.2.5]
MPEQRQPGPSLADPRIDAVVRKVIRLYETTFPDRIAACYVEGSYADQTWLPTSDLDLLIVFRGRFADDAARQAAKQTWAGNEAGTHEVDISVIDEHSLREEGVYPSAKLGGRLLYGEDVLSLYPIVPIEEWARERMNAAYWLTINVYQRPIPVRLPLPFPDPADEFYGYTNRTVTLADGREVPCTRNLVRTTGWAATALLAFQAGQYVGRKRAGLRLYREHIGDEWTPLLAEIATFCRDRWQYLIPEALEERARLRSICQRALGFEQHFLTCYKPCLLNQLRSTNPAHVRFASWVQQQVPLDDPEVIAALQALK